MKYLKTYESHLVDNIQVLKDISLELDDNGFKTIINSYNGSDYYENRPVISVMIFKKEGIHDSVDVMGSISSLYFGYLEDFKFDEAASTINHMISYMESVNHHLYNKIVMGLYIENQPKRFSIKKEELKDNSIKYVKYIYMRFMRA